jgi:hypothetical protein
MVRVAIDYVVVDIRPVIRRDTNGVMVDSVKPNGCAIVGQKNAYGIVINVIELTC